MFFCGSHGLDGLNGYFSVAPTDWTDRTDTIFVEYGLDGLNGGKWKKEGKYRTNMLKKVPHNLQMWDFFCIFAGQ